MRAFKRILVPTDFGPASLEAVDLAVTVARTFDAELTLLHVWEIPDAPRMDFMLHSTAIARVEDAAVSGLDRALEAVRRALPKAHSMLRHGAPWSSIMAAIDELNPDLVVMGTHGRRGVSHAILGSVAERVVRDSPVPVLTVHASSTS